MFQRDLEYLIKTKHEGLSFDCDQCNKTYGTSYLLWMMDVSLQHSVTQSFECYLCQKVRSSKTVLDFHMTTHYLDENIFKAKNSNY